MLELNGWFFVQLGNFFLLLLILNKILYKPILNIINQRKETLKALYDEIHQMEERQREMLDEINSDIAQAQQKARGIFNSLRDTGVTHQKALVFEAEQTIIEMNEQMVKDIKSEVKKAHLKLHFQIELFSHEIIKKITAS